MLGAASPGKGGKSILLALEYRMVRGFQSYPHIGISQEYDCHFKPIDKLNFFYFFFFFSNLHQFSNTHKRKRKRKKKNKKKEKKIVKLIFHKKNNN